MIILYIRFEALTDNNPGNNSNHGLRIALDSSIERLNALMLNEIRDHIGGDFSIPLLLGYQKYLLASSLCSDKMRWDWENIKFLLPLEFVKFLDSNLNIVNIVINDIHDIGNGDCLYTSIDFLHKDIKNHSNIGGSTIAFKGIENQASFPKIGIILRQWEALEYSKNCISDILKTGYPNLELYLIDDASIDGSYLELKYLYPKIKVIRFLRRQEYTRCLNVGAEVAISNECEYLFFTNNDTRGFVSDTRQDFFTNLLLEFSEDNKVGIVCPRVMGWDGEDIKIRCSKKLGLTFDIATEAYLIPVSLWKAINGFDISLVRYCEDMMMLERIKSLGFQATICMQSTFSHFGMGSSAKQVVIPTFYRVRNGIIVLKKTISMREKDFYIYLYKWLRPHALLIKAELKKLWLLRALTRLFSLLIGLLVGFNTKYSPSEDWHTSEYILTTQSIALLNIDRFFEKEFQKINHS